MVAFWIPLNMNCHDNCFMNSWSFAMDSPTSQRLACGGWAAAGGSRFGLSPSAAPLPAFLMSAPSISGSLRRAPISAAERNSAYSSWGILILGSLFGDPYLGSTDPRASA